MEDIIIKAAEYVKDIFTGNSDGHDYGHAMRVYHNARLIAENYPECDITSVCLAALLHDVDDHKLFNTTNNENARRFLFLNGINKEQTEKICRIINGVSFSKNRDRRPDTIEGMIVQDADRLDALGAVGIARAFAYGGKNGRSLQDTIRHFHEKLLLLKDEMNTEEAKEIALSRHKLMLEFLEEMDKETTEIQA